METDQSKRLGPLQLVNAPFTRYTCLELLMTVKRLDDRFGEILPKPWRKRMIAIGLNPAQNVQGTLSTQDSFSFGGRQNLKNLK